MRWIIGTTGAITAALGLILLFLLTSVTRNATQFDRFYVPLLWVNIAVAVVLLLVVIGLGARLLRRLWQKRFGSRLLAKIAIIFLLVGAAPGLLIYVVSFQFVSRSIESWFDVKVESALEAGLNLGRTTLDQLQKDLETKARQAATQLTETGVGPVSISRARERIAVDELTVLAGSGQVVSFSSANAAALVPEIPSPAQLRQARSARTVTWAEPIGEGEQGGLRLKALVLMPLAFGVSAEPRYLQAVQMVPDVVARNALAVEEAYKEYQERALGRQGLQRMYLATLTLALCLAVFGAILMAVVLGNQLARPLLLLAEGMKAVAEGDLSPKRELLAQDELAGLTRDFSSMTAQLAEARSLAETRRAEVEQSRGYLQSLLDNMTSGVLVTNSSESLHLFNPAAERILKCGLRRGMLLEEVTGANILLPAIRRGRAQLDAETDHWIEQVELKQGETVITLLMRGARLGVPGEMSRAEHIILFDDITELISAQRSVAWAEVARRVAHEIKNPLTPIQLSAERLERRLADQLPEESRALLQKGVGTIVNQVNAMKRMVNDFRDYARLPPAELKLLDLNELVDEVVSLYASDVMRRMLRVELSAGVPPIMGDSSQLRQVIHNLMQNSLDAVGEGVSAEAARITIKTEVSEGGDGQPRARLVVTDNGPGFAQSILNRAFEPYATTKSSGTGLGLAIVKKIMDEHGARIECRNVEADGVVIGAQVSLTFKAGSNLRLQQAA
jgi:nitrogen fixation/metabolism regulation signal transduction histidine kinase